MQNGFIKEIDRLKDFLINSNLRVDHRCNYDLSFNDLITGYEHYLETGEYVLNDLSTCYQIKSIIGTEYSFGVEERRWIYKYLSHNGFWNTNYLLSEEMITNIKEHLRWQLQRTKHTKTYKFRRQKSLVTLANKKFREKVFEIKGKVCVSCGAKENLSIDHIIPVLHGGTEDLDNLQILCISCNSSKGAKYAKD